VLARAGVQTGGMRGGARLGAVALAMLLGACSSSAGERTGASRGEQAPANEQASGGPPSSSAPGQGGTGAAANGGGGNAAGGPAASGGAGGAAAGEPCRSSQLAVKLVDATRGSAGWSDWLFELRNTSVTPCTLAGYPSVQLLDAAKHPLATLEERGAGPALTGRVATTVPLPAGGAAVFGIETYGCVGSSKSQAPAVNLMVTPPGETTALLVTVDPPVTSCNDGRFVTSPVRSDPSGVAT